MKHWIRKFHLAARGVFYGIRGQTSFAIHLPVAVAVVALAALLRCTLWQWCALVLCIGLVFAAELANSAIEELAAGLSPGHNDQVGRALDIASGAVLLACLTSATVGALIFITQFVSQLMPLWNR
ncbi:MAG: diacylglycerol kinase [Aureliella sp.]|jgi:diacylglycerol kinase (ATP)